MGHGRGHGLGCTHGGRGEKGSIQVEAGANPGKAQSKMNLYEIKERMQSYTKVPNQEHSVIWDIYGYRVAFWLPRITSRYRYIDIV